MPDELLCLLITWFETPTHMKTFRVQREITTMIKDHKAAEHRKSLTRLGRVELDAKDAASEQDTTPATT